MKFTRARGGLGEPATAATWEDGRGWVCHCGGLLCTTRGAVGGAIRQCRCGDWWRSRGGHGWERMVAEDDMPARM